MWWAGFGWALILHSALAEGWELMAHGSYTLIPLQMLVCFSMSLSFLRLLVYFS